MRLQTTRILLIICILAAMAGLTGCGEKKKAEEYVQTLVEEQKNGSADNYRDILNTALQEHHEEEMDENLHSNYESFLASVYKDLDMEVIDVKKNSSGIYRVKMMLKPLDTSSMWTEKLNAYVADMDTEDQEEAIASSMKLAEETLQKPLYEEATEVTAFVTVKKGKCNVPEKEWNQTMYEAVNDLLSPYSMVIDTFYIRELANAWMDAYVKGDPSLLSQLTGISAELLTDAYNEGFDSFDDWGDMGFSDEDKQKMSEECKQIFRTTKYEFNSPKKVEDGHYTVDITIYPVTSLTNALEELQQGTYYSKEEIKQALFSKLEEYIATPTYADPQTITVNVERDNSGYYTIRDEDQDQILDLILEMKQ